MNLLDDLGDEPGKTQPQTNARATDANMVGRAHSPLFFIGLHG